MKRIILLSFIALSIIFTGRSQDSRSATDVYGVAFYNLENLFDTINNNGKYDLEFSPRGSRQWDGRKYWAKIANLA